MKNQKTFWQAHSSKNLSFQYKVQINPTNHWLKATEKNKALHHFKVETPQHEK